ncbi:MAG: flagellar basal body protein [Hyphomicrobiales bacterium]|nr:flagellar basal body protein [Hyphomicrobiales bacterium]
MALGDLSLVGFLKSKMHWHQGRQRVLAENVANADTPGYRAVDLKPMQFEKHLRGPAIASIAAAQTHDVHFPGALQSERPGFATSSGNGWEITPEGNAVVLEEQMIKVSGNQFEYQLASTLYSRSLGLLKTALGRS